MSQSVKQGPMAHGRPDDFYTPDYALRPLIPFLNPDWLLWEPAAGGMHLAFALRKQGFATLATDYYCTHELAWPGVDFTNDSGLLAHLPILKTANCIVTNPPFSHKNPFMHKCIKLGKPFALLLPLTFLGTFKRQRLMAEGNIKIIFMGGRVNFITPSGEGSGSWFETAWFCGNGLLEHNVFPDKPIDRTPLSNA